MTAIHPLPPGSPVRPLVARRRSRPAMVRPQLRAIAARATPPAVAGTVVPTTLAALSAPAVQLNAAAWLPQIESLLAGPFGAPALALGCAVSAGVAATMRLQNPDRRAQVTRFLGAAGRAGLGAPLMFGALQMALGPAYTINMLARGVVFGMATLLGALAGRQAGQVASKSVGVPKPPKGSTFSERELKRHRQAHSDAARQGSKLGGLAAGAIVGVAALRGM